MTKTNTSYPNFSSGELSPKMYGRFDVAAYYSGCRRMENFIPQVVGSAQYRTGFRYVAKTAGNNPAFLYTFEFSEALSFVLEFTNQKIRFYRNDGQVRETAQAITGITNANPAVVTYSGADNYTNGDSIYIEGVEGMPEVNGREFTVAGLNAGANTFQLSGVDSSAYGAYTSGGEVSVITEVTSPYLEADLFKLKFAQNGVFLYIVHPSYAPRILTFTSPTSWTLTAHAPYAANGSSQAITGISQANPAVVTYAGADNFTNGDRVYINDVLGMTQVNNRLFTVAGVNAGANTFQLSGENSTAYTAWVSGGTIQKVQDASFLTTDNYPGAVAFFEQRLIYAGSNNAPQTLYFSKSADPDNFVIGTDVDDSITYTANGDNNSIQWMRGTNRFLAIGVSGDVLQATGGIDQVITPTSISIKPSNSYGVASINPIGKGTQVFYVQSNSLILRSFEYDFESDGYVPVDRNTIADHITQTGVKQITFQEGRPNIVWAIKNNGELIGMTIEDTESVSGWHRHMTDGEFISATSTPRDGNYHQLWACIERDGNYYMEYLIDETLYPQIQDYFTGVKATDDLAFKNLMFEAQKNYVHLDSALSYDGSGYASVTLTPAALTGTGITFTASGAIFTAAMVGRELWRKSVTGTETGRATITGYTSSTVVTCDILEDFDTASPIPIGEWFLTADTLIGLDHLEGKTVSVVADGGQHPQATVINGVINLDRQASVVHVGLPYVGWLVTTDLEGGGTNGPAQTKRKSVVAIAVRFLNSLFCRYGTDYYGLQQLYMRTGSMAMDRPPLPYTGDRKETYVSNVNDTIDGGWQRSKYVIISQDLPFPCNVQLIVPYMDVSNV